MNKQNQKAQHLQTAIEALKKCIALDVTDRDEDLYLEAVIKALVDGYNQYQDDAAQAGMQQMNQMGQMNQMNQMSQPMAEEAPRYSDELNVLPGNRGITQMEGRK